MSRDFDTFVESGGGIYKEDSDDLENADREDIFGDYLETGGLEDGFDLKAEVSAQMKLLKAIRAHIFYKDGQPKASTEPSDITSYMNASLKLLTMLKSLENDLKTDEDVRRIETALEMTMETCDCPEFVETLMDNLTNNVNIQ